MKTLLFLLLLSALAVAGCMSTADTFLVQKLDDEGKSQALTSAGIDEYQLFVVRQKAYDQIPRVREYFVTALTFDPGNAQAQQYLSLIDNFKAQTVKASLSTATKAFAKPKRTDEELYAAVVALRTAEELDPANAPVKKLLADNAAEWGKLRDAYLAKARGSVGALDEKSTTAARERAYADAWASANRALDVEPSNLAAQGEVRTLKAELTKLVTLRVDAIQKLVAAGKYADARTQVTGLSDMNRRTANTFDAEVRAQTYAVNFGWAKALYAQKDYTGAEARVDAAIAARRTGEATALKRTLVGLRTTADASVSFDTALAAIDKLIDAGDLLGAHRRLEALASGLADQARLAQLDTRDARIVEGLKAVYDAGLAAYRDEDFKTAIEKLSIVVEIQVDYEQASDYLDKAKAKQKLLDKF